MAFNILDSLNNNSKNVIEDKPSANFRTKDISIFNIYRNEKNFYQIIDIEELANSILLVGLMSNLVVVYEPNSEGKEYKLISGERRLEALRSLYEKGHKEYEYVTCQIKKEASEEEEEIEIIIANSSRVKTTAEMLQEESKLKNNLQKMKEEGKQLKGYDLNKGRLRDVVASILGISKTKVAQMENINNNLNSDFRKELEEGNINFATANEIAGIEKEKQKELYEETKENIKDLKVKDIKDIKEQLKDDKDTGELEGQIHAEEVINNSDDNILEKFEEGKYYVFSFEAYERYCEKKGPAVGGPKAHKYDWMEDLEGKEPSEIITEVSARMYTEGGYRYLRPYYFREMTPCEVEKKEENIRNNKKIKKLESLRFKDGYRYKYSFDKKAEYEYLKNNVTIEKSIWDEENDGKEVKVFSSRHAKLGDYRLNPWECVSSISNEESEETILEISNLEKIKDFDVIYMSEFMFGLINKKCEDCIIKKQRKCIFYEKNKEVTDRLCKKQIRLWLQIENTLENEFPKENN